MLKLSWMVCLFGSLVVGVTTQAAAQNDTGVVKLVVPYAPGGFPDTIGRLFAGQLSADVRRTIVVENRPGGAGTIAADLVAKSQPDGNTLLVADAQQWAIAPAMLKRVGYDVQRDFAPVTLLGETHNFLVVNPVLGIADFPSLVAAIKADPQKFNYGTPGVGSIHHLTMEVMAKRLGLKLTQIPYRGGSEVAPALLSGNVQLAIQALPSVRAFAQEGKLKILAVISAKRSKFLPDVPTLEELGVRDMDFPGAIGILAPAGTPDDRLARWVAAMNAAATAPTIIEKLATYAIEPTIITPDQLKAWIAADNLKFREAVSDAGLTPQ